MRTLRCLGMDWEGGVLIRLVSECVSRMLIDAPCYDAKGGIRSRGAFRALSPPRNDLLRRIIPQQSQNRTLELRVNFAYRRRLTDRQVADGY